MKSTAGTQIGAMLARSGCPASVFRCVQNCQTNLIMRVCRAATPWRAALEHVPAEAGIRRIH